MICGLFHQGSGLGNQLHRYVAIRVLAADKGYDWGMLVDGGGFKGDFFRGDFYGSNPVSIGWPRGFTDFLEKKVVENGIDVRGYDPEINFVEDNTTVDGEFQDQRYFMHRIDEVNEWLKVDSLKVPEDLCIIGFRGGEYTAFPDLFLPKSYWDTAIARKCATTPNLRFEVHTDDPVTAQQFFPDLPIVSNVQLSHSHHSNMGLNWRTLRYAKHAIISNSSFYILPRLLAHYQFRDADTIAPRYWARRNTKVWALPQNYYDQFTYL